MEGEVRERDNKSKLASDDSALKFHGRSHLTLISLHPEGRDGKWKEKALAGLSLYTQEAK